MIIRADDEDYTAKCKRVFRVLRFGPLAVRLEARATRYELVLIPCGGVSDIEEHMHDESGLYIVVTNFGAGMYLREPEAAESQYLAEKLRMKVGDTSSIAKFIRDIVREGHGDA